MLGLAITLCSAFFFGMNTTLARIAYDYGSNPATQVFLRSAFLVITLACLQLASGREIMLSRRLVPTTLAFSICILLMSFGYLSSVAYINVSLAVLIFYTYPLMVGVASPLLGRERMTWIKGICLAGAFVSLVIASSDQVGAFDRRGVLFALSAAVGVAMIALFGAKAMAAAHPFLMNAWMNLWVVIAVGLYLAGTRNFQFPQAGAGWIATLGVGLCYTLGILMLFRGLTLISPVQSAVTMNLEPLFSTLAAILLLHEAVALRQWFGMAMLLIFLGISTLTGMSRREKARIS